MMGLLSKRTGPLLACGRLRTVYSVCKAYMPPASLKTSLHSNM